MCLNYKGKAGAKGKIKDIIYYYIFDFFFISSCDNPAPQKKIKMMDVII